MPASFSARKWLSLPSRIALLLGIGALSAAGAKASTGAIDEGKGPAQIPQQSAKSFGEMLIWSEGARIYVSEAGDEPRELALGDTPEARLLRQMLVRDGAAAHAPRVLSDRLILVGGGGCGISWAPAGNPNPSATAAPGSAGANPGAPPQTSRPRGSGASGYPTLSRSGARG